jgi:ATP-dependent helicase/nuclease subunit A
LKRWRARAEQVAPFELYAGLLDGEDMRARMLARLGTEAADAIDEFLNLALAYDDGAPPSLQGFLELAARRYPHRQARHGAGQRRGARHDRARRQGAGSARRVPPGHLLDPLGRWPGSLLKLDDAERPSSTPAPFLWPVKGTSDLDVVQRAKAAAGLAGRGGAQPAALRGAERAPRSALCGGLRGPKRAAAGLLVQSDPGRPRRPPRGGTTKDGRVVWRLASAQTAKPEPSTAKGAASTAASPLPAWARAPAPQEPLIRVPLAPSRLAPLETDAAGEPVERPPGRLAEPPILPPTALAADGRFLRGTLTHGLLEHLPTLPKEAWAAAAEAFVASGGAQLPASVRKSIVKETLAVLRDPMFAPLFGPTSRAEVAIVADVPHPQGRGPALRLAGKIDRLVEDGTTILIVDYKTNRPPPKDVAQVAEAYLLQLAAYRLAVQRIFPALHVRAAILWTDGPRIMEISTSMLEAQQQRLWQLEPASLDA